MPSEDWERSDLGIKIDGIFHLSFYGIMALVLMRMMYGSHQYQEMKKRPPRRDAQPDNRPEPTNGDTQKTTRTILLMVCVAQLCRAPRLLSSRESNRLYTLERAASNTTVALLLVNFSAFLYHLMRQQSVAVSMRPAQRRPIWQWISLSLLLAILELGIAGLQAGLDRQWPRGLGLLAFVIWGVVICVLVWKHIFLLQKMIFKLQRQFTTIGGATGTPGRLKPNQHPERDLEALHSNGMGPSASAPLDQSTESVKDNEESDADEMEMNTMASLEEEDHAQPTTSQSVRVSVVSHVKETPWDTARVMYRKMKMKRFVFMALIATIVFVGIGVYATYRAVLDFEDTDETFLPRSAPLPPGGEYTWESDTTLYFSDLMCLLLLWFAWFPWYDWV